MLEQARRSAHDTTRHDSHDTSCLSCRDATSGIRAYPLLARHASGWTWVRPHCRRCSGACRFSQRKGMPILTVSTSLCPLRSKHCISEHVSLPTLPIWEVRSRQPQVMRGKELFCSAESFGAGATLQRCLVTWHLASPCTDWIPAPSWHYAHWCTKSGLLGFKLQLNLQNFLKFVFEKYNVQLSSAPILIKF